MGLERSQQIQSIATDAMEAPTNERDSPAEQDAQLRSLLESALGKQFEIIRPLGRGGMGSVYLARERALERFVAIKVLRPDLAVAESHRERFRREARIAARLSHPGILALHSFGEIDNLWYFVMTYVRGETLAERIRREGPMRWEDALRVFTEIAAALECAHRNGVVHRDIKPANILLDSESGRAMLADFGISKMPGTSESLTAPGAMLGTPVYMSPEQLSAASDIDERSDIYSLGAVAYLMLAGREPFTGTTSATVYRRLAEDAPPVSKLVSSIPADLSAIVGRCMARERSERWPNAGLLREALDGVAPKEGLPDVVRHLRSFGPYAVLWAVGFAAIAILTRRSASERALLLIGALIAPVGLMLHLWNGAGRRMRLIDIVRRASCPPEWWTMWWPSTLRRPTDLWGRLPWVAKGVRIFISLSFPALFFLILLRGRLSPAAEAFYDAWIDVVDWSILGVASLAVAGGFLWARRAGLSIDQSLRLLLGATLTSPEWDEPALRRVLAPPRGKVRAPDGNVPSDYVRAIRELLPLVAVTGGDAGLRTAGTAERVLKEIDLRDAELAKLSRDAGPDEENRLALQLDSLSSPGGETREHVELRELVRHQLDLVRRMQSRREVLLRDRAHLVDLLRSLWSLVRAAGDSQNGETRAVEKLQALCIDIRAELDPAA